MTGENCNGEKNHSTHGWRAMIVLVAILLALLGFGSAASAQGSHPQKKQSAPTHLGSRNGEKLFATSCAGCHGLDGRGGERAPSIAVGRVQRLSDDQIFGIIQHGITGTGMPSFHSLAEPEIKSLVAHLRILQGTKEAMSLPGDSARGKALFFGKAGCSSCHMAAGRGGFIASDLSGYARTHSADETRSAITKPNPNEDRLTRAATVTTHDGEKYMGRVRNEDNFSLQLQDLDGTFHFFAKSDIEGVEYNSQSLMPSNYGSTLSSDELNDLISYMMSVANGSDSATPKEIPEED
jgi:putative heme-binding domain-containing protein